MMSFVQAALSATETLRRRATRDLAMGRITKQQWEQVCFRLDKLNELTGQIRKEQGKR